MTSAKAQITRRLEKLISLPLAIARDAGNMKGFHFGAIRPHPGGKGTVSDYALHIQCPWRIVGSAGIVTGSLDYYERANPDEEVNLEDPQAGNLQRKRFGELLRLYDPQTRSWINGTDQLIVESVLVDDFGGFELALSGGFRLQVFPCRSRGEDWRLFAPRSDDHLVLEAGRIET